MYEGSRTVCLAAVVASLRRGALGGSCVSKFLLRGAGVGAAGEGLGVARRRELEPLRRATSALDCWRLRDAPGEAGDLDLEEWVENSCIRDAPRDDGA